ncbi:MAG: sel1 repeat family protein [Pirellulales bacterium]|nr:sel1 repeat family protein [Pirellulales bacterium]
MAKFLRFISHDFTDGEGRPRIDLRAAANVPETAHLTWMYEHYATPLPADGVSKVNVLFTVERPVQPPAHVLGIATVFELFDLEGFLALAGCARQRFFVERLHHGVKTCARSFGWASERLDAAYARILGEDFRFAFAWKKPVASPDRRIKVQAHVEANVPSRIELVFSDRQQQVVRRIHLSNSAGGPGAVEFALGDIRWIDAHTIRVTHDNGRDFWTCTTGGQLAFHYPRADGGDPHGEYDLGRMYLEGQWVLPDHDRGLALIRAAADKGFAHAIRFLAHRDQADGRQ